MRINVENIVTEPKEKEKIVNLNSKEDIDYYYKTFSILNIACKLQLGLNVRSDLVLKQYKLKEINDYFIHILKSDFFKNKIEDKDFNIRFTNFDEEIIIPNLIYSIIFPEILINLKKYSKKEERNIIIEFDLNNNSFIFTNNTELYEIKSKESGLEMCKKIISKINDIKNSDYEIKELDTDTNIYTLIVKLWNP